MQNSVAYPESNRMLCELTSVQVTCEECGRSNSLGFEALQRATFSGVYSYELLVARLKCKVCPSTPRRWRRLRVRPEWRLDYTVE
ncbi:hypothetical protein C8J32_10416 [Rhizobium sp. PP-CC-3A-592]|nr:hypothetical protein C8J32_10416 [Rhizobium sp. PP-CC-3A-592]